jgi:hypothetical protein
MFSKTRTLIRASIVAGLIVTTAQADSTTVTIEADRDASLIEDVNGDLASGAGTVLFVGRTGQREGSLRRGLLRFDLGGALPPRAVIESVQLAIFVPNGSGGPRELTLHRVLADWGEGASASGGGSGAAAEAEDATWVHAFYPYETWVKDGGQAAGPSGRLVVGDGPSAHVVPSSPTLVKDVRLWLRAPHRNFGWMLRGDESESRTGKRIASREHPNPALRPLLHVTFRLPGPAR